MSDNTRKALTIAEQLRSARATSGLTQGQVAAETGIKQANISRYESGVSKPNAGTYDALMNFYRNASSSVAEMQDAYHGVLGIQGRSQGKLRVVSNLMAPPTPKEWLVHGFIAKRHVTILAGQEGSGKTMCTNTVAEALARGALEVFSLRMTGNAHRVLIIDVENVLSSGDDTEEPDGSLLTERLQSIGLDEETAGNITVAGVDGFDLDKDMDVLDGILADAEKDGLPYSLVILDSFRSLWTSGSENTPEAGRVLRNLNKVAARRNAAVLLLHHTNKAGAAYSGHTSIGSTVAALWTFSKLTHKSPETGKKEQHPTLRYLFPYKCRLIAEPPARIVSTSDHGIVSAKSAEDFDGFTVDMGEEDDATQE